MARMAGSIIFSYDDERDGALGVGTVTGAWVDIQDATSLLLQGVITNSTGTTQVFVDFSRDGVTLDQSSTDQFANLGAGVALNAGYRFVRGRLVQATAAATNAEVTLKTRD